MSRTRSISISQLKIGDIITRTSGALGQRGHKYKVIKIYSNGGYKIELIKCDSDKQYPHTLIARESTLKIMFHIDLLDVLEDL